MIMRDSDGMELQDRLHRIEEKLDRLTDQLSEMGRIDERTDAAHARLNRHETRIDWIEKEHRDLVEQFQKHQGSTALYERAGWVVFAAVVGAVAHLLR
jgi:predicted nuclease with TOPRIM domain